MKRLYGAIFFEAKRVKTNKKPAELNLLSGFFIGGVALMALWK
jgi:hypothetical protein